MRCGISASLCFAASASAGGETTSALVRTTSCSQVIHLGDPDAQISIPHSTRDAAHKHTQHVPQHPCRCQNGRTETPFEESSEPGCLSSRGLSRRAPGIFRHSLRSPAEQSFSPLYQSRPVRAAMSRITWAVSQLHVVGHHGAQSAANGLTVQSGTGLHLQNHAQDTSLNVQLSPGLNTPSLTSIKATCFNPASCGDSDVATSQCCEVQDQLNAGSLSTEQKSQAASHRTLHAATPGSGVRSRHGAMCTRPCYSTQIASASPVASPGSRVRGPR